jgi:hypothetical protein
MHSLTTQETATSSHNPGLRTDRTDHNIDPLPGSSCPNPNRDRGPTSIDAVPSMSSIKRPSSVTFLTYQFSDGWILNAVGELLAHGTHNDNAPSIHRRDAEYMIRDPGAFYGRQHDSLQSRRYGEVKWGFCLEKRESPAAGGGRRRRNAAAIRFQRSAQNQHKIGLVLAGASL